MKPLSIAQETPLIAKTKELCATILEQPGYAQMKQHIIDFLRNEEARGLYETLCDRQEVLSQKQENGQMITEEEDNAFGELEEKFLAMPVAENFIKAQRQMHKIEKTVSEYVRKTFELGRVPEESDFSSGSCGPSCGCH
ncbi:MAG TPA: YlbF family regulator [Kiritimatiellia bacterium]|nr:YlbF family regulator [Kiritimatiellia bacterium]HMP35561.1 YlbF family regulator [Kiritimatiellia bacterium]